MKTMANLTYTEKEALENLLAMHGGYVSDFTNRQFADFMFSTGKIQIYSEKYSVYGPSKACRLRAFWDQEPSFIVGNILKELVQREVHRNKKINKSDSEIAHLTVNRLLGISSTTKVQEKVKTDEELFLEREFQKLNLSILKIDSSIITVIEERIKEIQICIKNKSSLAAIILMGSTLEGLLLGFAIQNPKLYNQAESSPKDKQSKVLPLHKWTLANLIDVSFELNFLDHDIQKFSHVLRDFRNYVHPYHQLSCNFTPDSNTIKICWQVVQAAIDDLGKGGLK